MSVTLTTVLAPLAVSLLKRWVPMISGDRTAPDESGLTSGLVTLTRLFGGFRSNVDQLLNDVSGLDPDDVKFKNKIEKFAKDLSKVDEFVKKFQGNDGILSADGILGNSTLSALLRKLGCPDTYPDESGIEIPAAAVGIRYQYFIQSLPEVPTFESSKDILMEAWASWNKVCGVESKLVPAIELANVVVRAKNIDGTGPILGQATLGPLGKVNSILELEMDANEPWDESTFRGALCHEIGHLIGLDHDDQPGRLMSAVIQSGIIEPTDDDAARARGLWGNPPEPGPVFDKPSFEFG